MSRHERLFRGPYLHGLRPTYRAIPLQNWSRIASCRTSCCACRSSINLIARSTAIRLRRSRARRGGNVIVSTGTGSGKTLTFLIPILAGILEQPADGVHALLLYPMNALVNDQLKNLRRILRDCPDIRFGRYVNSEVTRETERDGRRLHPEAPPNEVVSRQVFRQAPPHILITNYAMLE